MSNSKFLNRLPVSSRQGAYSIHQAIAEKVGKDKRTLWRRCDDYALVVADEPIKGCDFKSYDPSPVTGQITRFDLIAEVSVSKKTSEAARSRRTDPILEARFASNGSESYDVIADRIGRDWLDKKGLSAGFEIIDLHRAEYTPFEFVRKGQSIRVGAVRFAGRLQVTNADAFRAAMLNGIGHSKAWGCGLLLCFGN